MLTEVYQITSIAANVCVITITVWLIIKRFQVKKIFTKYIMDNIDTPLNLEETPQDNKMKERLIQVVAGGKSKEYLGKLYSTEDIEKLDDKEIAKLYARYEAVLGGIVNQTLKQHMIYAYTRAVEFLCPTVSQGRFAVYDTQKLHEHLTNGPFINLALTSLTCKLYHDYGHFLAPLEAALLTSNYVQPANEQLAQQKAMQQQAMQQAQQQAMQQAQQQAMQRQQVMQQQAMQQQAMQRPS